MKVWKLNAPNNLRHEKVDDLSLASGEAKIKITKSIVSEPDVAVFCGLTKVKYPVVPGHYALGQVTETDEYSFMKKGDRVYLPPVREDELTQSGLTIAGETIDGFFGDFVVANADEAYVLPASVSDEAAFLIDAVALAEHVVDEMQVDAGQHILVIGGGLYGNILCQILIYHRAVPILIDNNQERLALAKKSGIYYTFKNDETLQENVSSVTGGFLADGAVYLAFSNKSEPSSLFKLLKHGAKAAFCALTPKKLTVDLENAMKSNVTLVAITESREFISTAINILANKAVVFSSFPYRYFAEKDLPKLLEEYSKVLESGNALPEELTVVNFVF
ncbi:MAG: zinc-binding dehydrogenase [Clostridia bacterium]|nr:zinc-binding dehydrogenase [Clostridia bacterium]